MSTYTYADKLRFQVKSFSEYFRKFPLAVKRTNRLIDFPTLTERPVQFGLVETTHSSPIGQKHTGWGDDHIPELGWLGRYHVTDTTKRSTEGWFWSDRPEGFNSGTGGGGHYEFRIYLKDFPKIEKRFLELIVDEEFHSIYGMLNSTNKEDKQLAESFLQDKRITDKLKEITSILEYQGNMPMNKSTFRNILENYLNYESKEYSRAYCL